MQTAGDVKAKVAALVGDPYFDWLTDPYFFPLANTAYEGIINNLALTCSPFIERVVTIPGVDVGYDESNLGPNSQKNALEQVKRLKKPRFIQWKQTGQPVSRYREAKLFGILPNTPSQPAPMTIDLQIRGDFMPDPLKDDTSMVVIHPNMGPCLAMHIAALIGAERPNQGWAETYGEQGKEQLGLIEMDLVREQQGKTFRLGSPNYPCRGTYGWNLTGNVGWEWRAYALYVKLI